MKKTMLIAILVLLVTYLGTIIWFETSTVVQEEYDIVDYDVVNSGPEVHTDKETPYVEIEFESFSDQVSGCTDVPGQNVHGTIICYISNHDGPFLVADDCEIKECEINSYANASWDNEAWFQY